MAIQVTYKKQINDKLIKNYVLFSNESFKIYNLNQIFLKKKEFFINELITKNRIKNKVRKTTRSWRDDIRNSPMGELHHTS